MILVIEGRDAGAGPGIAVVPVVYDFMHNRSLALLSEDSAAVTLPQSKGA
jgi:hypothetical protein